MLILKGLHRLDVVSIPPAETWLGSTLEEIQSCVDYWSSRLIDMSYTATQFRNWILKEYPKHPVTLSAYSIGRFPVTNMEYRQFTQEACWHEPESLTIGEPNDHPVWGVTYEDAIAYAHWIGEKVGHTCSIPTEAQWEYAARGYSGYEYPFGPNFLSDRCNTIESGIGHTTPVDRYLEGASEFGVCDLAGNVEEWTMDVYEPYRGGSYIHDDLISSVGTVYRVMRGGSFALGGDLGRCARRHGPFPGSKFKYRGFRIVFNGSI